MFQTPQKQACLSQELRDAFQQRNLLTSKSRKKVCSMLDQSLSSMHVVSPLTARLSDSELDKRKGFRSQALQEIINTEKAYLRQLELLMQFFVRPLKQQAIIDEASHTLLFGQIEMIHNLNGEFLSELEADIEKFAQAFLKMAPFFKLYSVYAFDYRNALFMLQDLTSRNPVFRKFLEQTESRPEVQRKLNSLMIAPIQRVPRYKLLLEQVLQYTSPADRDYKLLKESIKQIESTVSHINSCVEDQEVTQKLINIQNSLLNRTPNIVKPSRKVIKEGVLNKVNRKGTEIKRYCVLMSDIFMYCKILKDRTENTIVENALECCCIFPLKKCKVHKLFSGTFKVTCQGDAIILCTNNQLNCLSWVSLIQEAINLHVQCRKTLRKESSKRKPLRKKELKKFGMDYDVLSPSKKKLDYETVFRNRTQATDSSDDDEGACNAPVSLNCFKPKKGKLVENPDNKKISSTQSRSNEKDSDEFNNETPPKLITHRRGLKRSAPAPPAPPTPRPALQRTVCSPAFASPQGRNVSVKERLTTNLSNAYRRIRTTTSLSKLALRSQTVSRPNAPPVFESLNQVNANNENDASYAFTASRYSETKSYFRANNVDNTLPTAVKREGILMNLEANMHTKAKSDDFGYNEFENENLRDILYPLRCSGGSTKSSNTNFAAASGTIAHETAPVAVPEFDKGRAYGFESYQQPPPKKRVKFEAQTKQSPYLFAPVTATTAYSSSSSSSIATVMREKICSFFANLF